MDGWMDGWMDGLITRDSVNNGIELSMFAYT